MGLTEMVDVEHVVQSLALNKLSINVNLVLLGYYLVSGAFSPPESLF